jgi:hypothetical protein
MLSADVTALVLSGDDDMLECTYILPVASIRRSVCKFRGLIGRTLIRDFEWLVAVL